MDNFEHRLREFCARAFGDEADIAHIRRLSGGANMESWSFDYGNRGLVLRRLPEGVAAEMGGGAALSRISLEDEARLIEKARASGVAAPRVFASLRESDGIGAGFLMERISGEALPHRILCKPEYARAQAALTGQCARELARIHSIDPDLLPASLPFATTAELLAQQWGLYEQYGADIPVFELAFSWLRGNIPEASQPGLLHGDFRMGNLLIDRRGIAAVLDWELAHIGDPAQDLAYLCTPSWRFGHYDKPVGGFGETDELLTAYARAGGGEISPERFRFWLVYSTLWWGICCLTMANIWRSGIDRSLERIVIGRRTSEVEIDLLLLFDGILGWSQVKAAPVEAVAESACVADGTANDLMVAIGEWVESAVLASAEGRLKFEARVARNALAIVERELADPMAARNRSPELNMDRLTLTEEPDDTDRQSIATLKRDALSRCAIDQPKYAGFARARERWRE